MKIPIPTAGPKVSTMIWTEHEDFLVTGHDNGDMVQWDMKTQKKMKMSSEHNDGLISDISLARTEPCFHHRQQRIRLQLCGTPERWRC